MRINIRIWLGTSNGKIILPIITSKCDLLTFKIGSPSAYFMSKFQLQTWLADRNVTFAAYKLSILQFKEGSCSYSPYFVSVSYLSKF